MRVTSLSSNILCMCFRDMLSASFVSERGRRHHYIVLHQRFHGPSQCWMYLCCHDMLSALSSRGDGGSPVLRVIGGEYLSRAFQLVTTEWSGGRVLMQTLIVGREGGVRTAW
jgi:hypothetical protein